MDELLYIIVILVNFIGFFIKGVAGFGDPLITNPLLAMVLENKVISPFNLCYNAPLNAYISWKNRKAFSLGESSLIVICMLCGVIPGTMVLKYGGSLALKACLGVVILGIGVVILGIGVEMLTRDRANPVKSNNLIMAVVSFFSGVTAGLYGINLFFVAYTERTAKGRESFRGNICFVFLIENIFRMALYIVSGVYNSNVLTLALIGLPGMMLGFLAGSRVEKKLSDKAVRNIVIVLFMLSGASILLKLLVWKV